jgi:hypothetical protein
MSASKWIPFLEIKTVLFYNCSVIRCNKNPIDVFPEKELHGVGPKFDIHVSVRDLYIPRIGPYIFLQQDRQIDTLMWELVRPRNSLSGNICFEFSVL